MPNVNSSFVGGHSLSAIQHSIDKINQSAKKIAQSDSSTDPIDDVVTQIESKHEFSVNIRALKTKDETLGTLLDLFS